MPVTSDSVPALSVFTPTDPAPEVMLAVYGEVCRSYHTIDESRTKLLGILPIASLAGILLLDRDTLFATGQAAMRQMVGFGSFFAAAFTLALFLFEIRGILRCDHLIKRGKALEESLKVKGQFYVCAKQQESADASGPERIFNVKIAASTVYSLVFAAWFFMALKFSFAFSLVGCGLTASLLGGLLAMVTNKLLSRHIAS
jgi:hypothetical protein